MRNAEDGGAKKARMALLATTGSSMSSLTNFVESGGCFVRMLETVPEEKWDRVVIGGASLRELSGHTVRAILTVDTYLMHDEPDRITIPDAERYYSTVYPTLFDPRQMRMDGISAGDWLGADPAASAADALSRTRSTIEAQPLGRVVSIGGSGIPLMEYLRTRVLELVLHTVDLAEATDVAHRLPDASVQDSAALADVIPAALRHGEARVIDLVQRR